LTTAARLGWLHIRRGAAGAALDAALGRGAVVARAVSATLSQADELRTAADTAESAARHEREAAESRLTRLLAEIDRPALPEGMAAELADAQQRARSEEHRVGEEGEA